MVICYRNDVANIFNNIIIDKITRESSDLPILINSIITVSLGDSFMATRETRYADTVKQQRLLYNIISASENQKKVYRKELKRGRTRCNVQFRLKLIIGARVMLLKNIDIEHGLINGTRGIIKEYIYNQERIIISIIIDFDGYYNNPVALQRQLVNKHSMISSITFKIYQFPIRLSWCVTAHKAKGQTLDKVAMNISENAFSYGVFYVAISRVRRLCDIIFFGMPEWPNDGIQFHINEFICAAEDEIVTNAIYECGP
jgi:ATP-dependent DNA helicase PIF1